MKVLVTMPVGIIRDTFIPADVKREIESLGTAVWNEADRNFTGAELSARLPGVDVCITGWHDPCFDETVLAGADSLKLVAYTGGSVANSVSDAFYDRGLRIVSGNWLFAESVAEGVVAYILCSLRDLPLYHNQMQAGIWQSEGFWNEGLLDRSVGLVGFGAVARYLVPMLKPFRVKIKAYDPFVTQEAMDAFGVEKASLEDVLSRSDIISLHAARNEGTYHMITRELLRTIPDGALFVNTARSSIVDEAALADELALGRFKAILDVYDEEPLPADSRLRGLRNAILMPHMAGPTLDRRKYVTLSLIDEIRNFFAGRPLKYEIGREYARAMTK